MNELDQIKRDLNIVSFEKLTNTQMYDLLSLAGKGRLSVEKLQQIAAMVPHFAEMAGKCADSLYKTAEGAASSQGKAIDALREAMQRLDNLTKHPSADAELLKLVATAIYDIATKVERLNESNNSFWKNAFATLGGVSALGVAVVGLAYLIDSDSSEA